MTALAFTCLGVGFSVAFIAGLRVVILNRRLRARERLAAIVEHTDDAIFSLTPAGEIGSWNGGADRLYAYSLAEAVGIGFAALVPLDREQDERARLGRVLAGAGVERYETVHLRRDGTRIDVSLTLSPVRDAAGVVVAASVIARDITERKRFEVQLQYLADHDALTGLFNRRRFEEDLERELARARRAGSGGALLAIDLDNFKEINDSFGHSVGDEVLIRIAELLSRRLRSTDLLSRLGGDEFVAILPGSGSRAAFRVAASLLEALEAQAAQRPGPGAESVTASIGIVTFDGREGVSAAELLARADIAMYDAKRAGRNRAAAYREQEDRRSDERSSTEVEQSKWVRARS
jgi:diguanylate cyclase (GGDEF)-like protein/PAS domain S-box-containing protein